MNAVEVVERLGSEQEAVRKLAAFKLQSYISDPPIADAFVASGGVKPLRALALTSTGNTLAYSLTSLSKLLDVDRGWDGIDATLLDRIMCLVIKEPLVNILRPALSVLVCVVGHGGGRGQGHGMIRTNGFLEAIVNRLRSADHVLCANSLMLINALTRDALDAKNMSGASKTNSHSHSKEWEGFVQELRRLGVQRAVSALMQHAPTPDLLLAPLQDFQSLTLTLLHSWSRIRVDPSHLSILDGIWTESGLNVISGAKWTKLGFATEFPLGEFAFLGREEEKSECGCGWLGLSDLEGFVGRDRAGFRKLLLEQLAKPEQLRCPLARASITVTNLLYAHFSLSAPDRSLHPKMESPFSPRGSTMTLSTPYDNGLCPLLLSWGSLHHASLLAFFRLWAESHATIADFDRVKDLVEVLLSTVMSAPDTKDKGMKEVERELFEFEYRLLRRLQLEGLEGIRERTWEGPVKDLTEKIRREAWTFVRWQRIKCLGRGEWFPIEDGGKRGKKWRFVKLEEEKTWKCLHIGEFDTKDDTKPNLDMLPEKVDLSLAGEITSAIKSPTSTQSNTSTLKSRPRSSSIANALKLPPTTIPQIVVKAQSPNARTPLLILNPQTLHSHAEWLDGLLIALGRDPVCAETEGMVSVLVSTGVKVRLMELRNEGEGVKVTGVVGEIRREGVGVGFHYGDPM
ncbi:hypothetical protein YB2330_003376 [Saitoella coloradoensis]